MPSVIVLFERTPPLSSAAPPPALREALQAAKVTLEVAAGPVRGPAIVEAAAQSEWPGADEAVSRHGAHVRLVASLDAAHGGEEPASRVPGLLALTRAALAVAALPGALALLHEDGRVLADPAQVARRLDGAPATPPLDLWVSLRRFQLADARGWFLDTLGMAQFGLADLECYAGDGAALPRMAAWLRNVSLHLLLDHAGVPLRHGDTLDGPDDQPLSTSEDVATAPPARPVLRFTPLG